MSVSVVNHIVERGSEVSIEERLGDDALAAVMMNFNGDGIEDYDELVAALDRTDLRTQPMDRRWGPWNNSTQTLGEVRNHGVDYGARPLIDRPFCTSVVRVLELNKFTT
uniref:Integrase core domain containing protein n=1 Tax=Solanum tuberosum TaxID=4113 RepID=M1DPA9_SOLTU